MPLSTSKIIGRLLLAALLAAIGELCLFGFLASFEPGSAAWFRIAYFALASLSFGGAIFMALSPLATRKSARVAALIGVCAGGVGAFLVSYLLVLTGPGSEAAWPFGLSYAVLAAPVGAIIGGALGALLGLGGAGASK